MAGKLYLIEEQDYIAHIDGQVKMYDHVLTLAHETRKLLLDGKFAAVLRTLNKYEHEANETFLEWGIPDEYLCGGDTRDLQELLEGELLAVDDEACPALNRFLLPCCLTPGTVPGTDKTEEARGA